MLFTSPRSATCLLDLGTRLLQDTAFAQLFVGAAPSGDLKGDFTPCMFRKASTPRCSPHRHTPHFLAVQQFVDLGDIGHIGRRPHDAVHQARLSIGAYYMPKRCWLRFFVWCISGSRLPSQLLVKLSAWMIVESTMVLWHNDRPHSSRWPLTTARIPAANPYYSNRWRKFIIVVSFGMQP